MKFVRMIEWKNPICALLICNFLFLCCFVIFRHQFVHSFRSFEMVISKCWKGNRTLRPTFDQIQIVIADLLNNNFETTE